MKLLSPLSNLHPAHWISQSAIPPNGKLTRLCGA